MAYFLFFDTETTGVNKRTDRIVQIAWMISDETGHILTEENHYIKPDNFTIPKPVSRNNLD